MRRLAVLLLLLPIAACGEKDSSAAGAGCSDPTISGTDDDDKLRGTPEADVIDGRGGDDRITGLGGDDVLCGGQGADVLDGGEGDDHLIGGEDKRQAADTDYYEWYGDTLAGGPGNDVLEPVVSETDETRVDPDQITFADSSTGVTVDLTTGTVTGEGTDRIVGEVHSLTGSPHADVLTGTDGKDWIEGGDGPDRIEGRGGKDFLHAGDGYRETNERHYDLASNTLAGGDGNDELIGSLGNDELDGGLGDDLLSAHGGADQIRGGAGDDQIADQLEATGNQRIDGGPGEDDFVEWFLRAPHHRPGDALTEGVIGTLDLAAGLLSTTIGDTAVRMPVLSMESAGPTYGSWTLIGTDGPNTLYGGFDDQGPATIRAGGGDDTLMGTFGFDTIDGGPGHDRVVVTGQVEDDVTGVEDFD